MFIKNCWSDNGKIVKKNIPNIKSKHEIKWFTELDVIHNVSNSVREKVCEISVKNYDFDELYLDFIYLKSFKPIVYDMYEQYEQYEQCNVKT